MTEIFINKAKTCAVTGHRTLQKDFNVKRLKEIFIKLIGVGYDTFLIGMAIGFDSECFRELEKLRKDNQIRLIACIPCEGQSYKFSEEQKKEYDRMVKSADERIVISKNYTAYCMMKRNRFMVDNSSCVVAYIKRDYGGTYSTVNYAIKNNVPIIQV